MPHLSFSKNGVSKSGCILTGLKIHEDGTGDIATTGGLVEVHGDTLELEIGVTVVCAGGVNTVLVGDDLPELGADLVAALAALNVNDFSHLKAVIAIIGDDRGGWGGEEEAEIKR